MDLADEAIRQRKLFSKTPQTMVERRHVVRDLGRVVDRYSWRVLQFEEKKIRKRRLRTLDLGREHRFLADVGVEEKRVVRQQRRNTIEAAESQDGRFHGLLQGTVQDQSGFGRQRRRHESTNALLADTSHLITAAFSALHGRTSLLKDIAITPLVIVISALIYNSWTPLTMCLPPTATGTPASAASTRG